MKNLWGGKKVLDIGSNDINGTYREIFEKSYFNYTGLDLSVGSNVDIVPEDIYHWKEIKNETFDLVISGQVFEHIEYPWLTIREIERVLKPSGFCIIIAPNAGWEHKAPKDCYRYYSDGLAALAKWAHLKVHHTSVGGVPETENLADWMDDWNDACLVAQKEPAISIAVGNPFVNEYRTPPSTYKLWESLLHKICNKFDDNKPIVLFGASRIGDIVLDILGEENIEFFIDSSKSKIGKEYRGKKIKSLDEYLKDSDRYNCLITATYRASLEIKCQMDKKNLKCETLYSTD